LIFLDIVQRKGREDFLKSKNEKKLLFRLVLNSCKKVNRLEFRLKIKKNKYKY